MIPISPRYRLDRLAAPVLRLGMTAAHGVRRLRWRMRGAVPEGVCAIVIAPDDAIVLVRHRYVRGWRIPSGGIHAGEAPRDAVIRELEEEIGLTAWSRVALAERRTRLAGGIGGPLHIFVVRDAVCAPRWSIEIAEVALFARRELPEPAATNLARFLDAEAIARD